MRKNKKVYVALSADILHKGHINILKTAKLYGDVYVGLLTDEAISSYKNIPYLDYEKRKVVVENIKYVKKVIPQKTLDYVANLNLIKPDYVVHGDDWKSGIQKEIRKRVIKTIKNWSAKLIEPKYTKNISSSSIKKEMANIMALPENRVSRLKRLMKSKKIVRILESHNALTGLIIDKINIKDNKKIIEFDGMWSSSLTDSATKGKPDNSSVDFSSRIASMNEMMDVTTKPLVFDADNGGQIEHLSFLVRSLERAGVSAIIMEDKVGLKKNSLFKNQAGAKQDKPKLFAKKIKKVCDTRRSKDFMVIARIESFILGKGLFGLTGGAFITFNNYANNNIDEFNLNILNHLQKKMTGPYHAVCSLDGILKNYKNFSYSVKLNKKIFIDRMKDHLMYPKKHQPNLCTLINKKVKSLNKNVVLYQSRADINGSVVCHLGEVHLNKSSKGKILDYLKLL